MRVLLHVACLVALAAALSPDLLRTQWRLDHVGRVCAACTAADGTLVVWGEGVVAALDAGGRIRWRRHASCPVAQSGAAGACGTLHTDEDGRLWQATNGGVDWSVGERRAVHGAAALSDASGWVLHDGRAVWAVSARTGAELWRAPALGEGEEVAALVSSAPVLLVTWRRDGAQWSVATASLDPRTGALSGRVARTLPSAAAALRAAAVVGAAHLLVHDADGALFQGPLAAAAALTRVADVALPDARLVASPLWAEAALVSPAAAPARVQRLTAAASRALAASAPQEGSAAVSADGALVFAAASNSSLWFDLRAPAAAPLALAGPNAALPLLSLTPLRPAAAAAAAAPIVLVQRADLRLDLFTADAAAAAPRLRRVWTRDEALAHVEEALFADLAAPPHSQLLDLFGASAPVASHRGEEARGLRQDEYRDRYGLRKQALLLTAAHSLHALSTDAGAQLWRTALPLAPHAPALWRRLLHSRASACLVAVVVQAHATHLVSLAPYTGALLAHETLPGAALHAAAHRGLVYVVDAAGAAFAWPRSPAPLAAATAARIFFVLHDAAAVRGFALAPADGAWRAEERWVYRAGAGERVAAVALADDGDLAASSVKVRSNGSVLHKSPLAPAALVVLLHNASAAALHAAVLHAPTGATLHAAVFRGAAEPISCVKAEHWHAVMFWDTRAHRQAVHVIELFSRPNAALAEHTALGWFAAWAFGLGADEEERAPRPAPDALHVLTQSYYLTPGPLSAARALGVTHTHSGVAGRLVVAGAASGHVLGLEKRLMDVRRVPRDKWTQFDSDEGLPPYNASFALAPRAALMPLPVHALRFVRSAPARLESTTHVLAIGTDVAYTHACPAGPFDRLSPDFNRLALVATLAALSLVTAVLALVRRTPPTKT